MNEGIKKFRELLLTDEEFRQKLKAATDAYTGDKSEEVLFNEVLVPLAAEYGISATYEEFRDYMTGDQEIDNEELAQIAGGKAGGFGASFCLAVGLGLGGGGGDGTGGGCVGVGGGWNLYNCWGSGDTGDLV